MARIKPPEEPTAACPSRQELERLRRGQLPFDQVEALAGHLERCAACVGVFAALRGEDILAEIVHQQRTALSKPPDAALGPLMERLRHLKGPATAATASDGPTPPPADAANPECYDFLAPPQQPDELGRLGPYRVLKILGSGGMGVVFQAEDPQLKRRVALKVIRPGLAVSATARQRFLREAQAAAALKHDHIVTIYQVGEDRGVPYLAMELLEGVSLENWLKKGRPLEVGQLLRLGRDIARGLAAAHARGLVHRDIKPANLWLEAPRGRVKILDFGLARATAAEARLTHQDAIVGTPAYMAPEQANNATLDARCDLFSLGCVLYRLATGRLPFEGATAIDLLVA